MPYAKMMTALPIYIAPPIVPSPLVRTPVRESVTLVTAIPAGLFGRVNPYTAARIRA
jgi:hypothetical protein